ncbi:amidohydrolase family protein [Kribbella capetownensis]|uniref:Amidohydrolase family protein n=1 Tax=Kribbella capetownensis TaxID=1572659 RepID=A0A4R0JH46_9ACTN|nr:amidohydrolase family protein [Kribbella capetownensis]TCC43928.1 amidohydrolase family protein [Kribbella capetownensis]
MNRIALKADRTFDGERFSGPGVVLVEDGKIAGVAATVPSDWQVQEVPGGTILPGLIDAHVHLCADSGPGALDRLPQTSEGDLAATIEQSLRIHLAAGVTTVRDLGDHNDAVLSWRARGVAGLPHVVAAGAPITSVGGHCWYLGGEAAGVEQLEAAVRVRAEAGADVIKIMASGGAMTPGSDTMSPQFTGDELRAAVNQAHDLGLPITAHAHALSAVRQALEAGVDGIEHCTCLTPDGVRIDADLLDGLAAAGIAVCATLGSDPSIVVPPEVLEMAAKSGISQAGLQQTTRRLYDGGVRIVAGSDGGIAPPKPHGLLPATLAEYVLAGLSEVAALTAATSTAAEVLGLRKGRVRPGYDADLLVVKGDPARDISALTAVAAVYLAGEAHSGSAELR